MWTLPPVRSLPFLPSPSRLKFHTDIVGGRVGYENEHACKKAIESFCSTSSVPRSEIFYTTKLRAPTTYEHAVESIKYSIEHAPGGYVDLYLMHSAIGGAELREESWRAFEWAKKEGLVRPPSPRPFPLLLPCTRLTESLGWNGTGEEHRSFELGREAHRGARRAGQRPFQARDRHPPFAQPGTDAFPLPSFPHYLETIADKLSTRCVG